MKNKRKMKKRKFRINGDVVLRNFAILTTIIILGIFINRISNDGISWLSTIGYFG